MHSVGYLRDVVRPALQDGARCSGRDAGDLQLYAPVMVVTGDTQQEMDEAAARARQQIAFYASTPSYRVVLDYHGYGSLGEKLNRLMRQGDLANMGNQVPEALLEQVAVVSGPRRLGGQAQAALRRRVAPLVNLCFRSRKGRLRRSGGNS